ncbi:protein of unknown function [Reichenbachiella faecimaris]|uniref:DUF4290 domain-containing protein n=1 Tax=Reichenbachiella faecimaris TaxID=692418 RepID=A0A1W2G8W7_REIFA|nr:DUF4290 domain-containing protein [Reichenbachiella faecimaris]SMD33041.1 protein of unknown function [Reichenbachiella faecimaris]
MIEYNTIREGVTLKEYGRNVQDLVAHLNTIEDKEERSKKAATLVELMKQINPAMQNTPEVEQKLWDDLHIISNFTVDIDGPFPTPSKEILEKKPDKMGYSNNNITFRHFGKNIELLVDKAITLEDAEEQEAAIIHIGKLMKTFIYSYNRDNIEDDVVYTNIRKLSKNQLDIDMEKVKAGNLFEPIRKERRNDRDNGGDRNDRNKNNRNKRNSNHKRRR